MVAFRWLVAVLVTVVTLFGGAFRAPTTVRAHLAIQSATHDAKQATLEVGRSIVQARATKPSTPDPRDRVGITSAATPLVRVADLHGRDTTVAVPSTSDAHPRLRTHAKHMVFLI